MYPLKPHTKPLFDMITALTNKAKQSFPKAANIEFVVTPDVLRPYTSIVPRVRFACHVAGYEEWDHIASSVWLAIRHAFHAVNKSDGQTFDLKREERALVIDYTQIQLSLAIIELIDENTHGLGMRRLIVMQPYASNTAKIRGELAQHASNFILDFLSKSDTEGKELLDLEFDEVYLLGDESSRPEFIDKVKTIFDVCGGERKPTIREEEEGSTFAVARGAAGLAREGLQTALKDCVPNDWCPQPPSQDATPPMGKSEL